MQAIGAGTTTVTLHANGMSASVSVTVTISGRQVDISPGSLTFDALGDTKSVRVRVLDEHGDEDPDATFSAFSTFSGNLPKGIVISWVDDVHLEVTAEGPGSGQITISSDGAAFAILPVTVFQEPASLEVSPASATLAVGRDDHGEGDGQGRERQPNPRERRRRKGRSPCVLDDERFQRGDGRANSGVRGGSGYDPRILNTSPLWS